LDFFMANRNARFGHAARPGETCHERCSLSGSASFVQIGIVNKYDA